MKNMPKKTEFVFRPSLRLRSGQASIVARPSSGATVSISPALIFLCIMTFTTGCGKVLKSKPAAHDFNPPDINQPRLEAVRILQEGLADNDPMVRVNTIEVVAATRQLKLMPKVLRLVNDEFVPVRFATALAIGDLQYALGQNQIQQLLKDKDINVKIAASYAMAMLGNRQYLEVLRKAILNNDQTVRANAVFLLGKSGDKTALKLLYGALQSRNSDDKVVYQAAESIARLGDERIYQKLWAMLISAYADVRVMGVKAMGALGTQEAKNALISMLNDDLPEIRLAAAEQLGALKDPVGEPNVLEIFEKNLTAGLDNISRERVNVLAAMAIGQIRTPSLTKFLPQLLKDESKFVRIAAAKAVLLSAAKQ